MYKSIRLSVISFICLMIVAAAFTVNATTYYVSTTGNDANSGTIDQPFRTVRKGVFSAKQPGDIVYIRAGTYDQGSPLSSANQILVTWSGTAGNPITLSGYPGEAKPIIRWDPFNPAYPQDAQIWGRINFTNTPRTIMQYWVVQDLEFINGCTGADSGFRMMFRRLKFTGGRIPLGGSHHQSTFDGNLITYSRSHGMYIEGTYNTITNSVIVSSGIVDAMPSGGYGIQGAAWPYGTSTSQMGPEYSDWKNNTVANNTIAYNRYSGIVNWQAGATNNIYENNILYENVDDAGTGIASGIQFMSSGGGNIVQNNLIYATAPGGTMAVAGVAGSWTESGTINANPQFVNGPSSRISSPDFHLLSGSPAIDRGLSIPTATTVDFAGATRPQGAAYDIGAYEFLRSSSILGSARSRSAMNSLAVTTTRTGVDFHFHAPGRYGIDIRDVNGRSIWSHAGNAYGFQTVKWAPGNRSMPLGIHVVSLKTDDQVQSKRTVLVK